MGMFDGGWKWQDLQGLLWLDHHKRYPKETTGYYFYYPLKNKKFVARYAEIFKSRLIKQEASGSTVEFDEIQSEEAQPSENTSLHQHEVEPDIVDPQTNVIPVRRSARIPQAPERYGFYIDAEEHELGDHDEPPNYRILNLKSGLKQ
ncbi:hypothetical protein Tco_0880165 [Tanacetum coccineum]